MSATTPPLRHITADQLQVGDILHTRATKPPAKIAEIRDRCMGKALDVRFEGEYTFYTSFTNTFKVVVERPLARVWVAGNGYDVSQELASAIDALILATR